MFILSYLYLNFSIKSPFLAVKRPNPIQSGREIGLGFLFGNSLIPKALGSGVDLNFLELCALFNNFRKMMGKHKSPFVELDLNQSAGAFYSQARGKKTIRDGVALHYTTLRRQLEQDEHRLLGKLN